MPRKKTTTSAPASALSTDALLSLLSPERRAAILEEIVGSHFRGAVEGSGSLGALVDTLKGHSHWSIFQKLPVSSLLQFGGAKKTGHSAPAASAHAAPAPAPAAKAPKPAAAQPAEKVKPAVKGKSKKFVRRTPEQIEANVGKVIGFIEKHPGLRSEQIAKQVGGDAKSVKDALARLRDEKKVKTTGIKRAMTYQLT